MSAIKVILLVEVMLLFSVSISFLTKDVIKQLQCEEPKVGIFERLSIWIGFSEEPERICMSRHELVQRSIRAAIRSLLVLLTMEIFRTVFCYFFLSENIMHITMSEKSSEDEKFAKFYWAETFKQGPRLVIYSHRSQNADENIIRIVNILTMTTITYNVKTGSSKRNTSLRLFSCKSMPHIGGSFA